MELRRKKIFLRINCLRDIGRITENILREAEHRCAWARRYVIDRTCLGEPRATGVSSA
jgi:hypothetical protein